jgi:hypothetical protein
MDVLCLRDRSGGLLSFDGGMTDDHSFDCVSAVRQACIGVTGV